MKQQENSGLSIIKFCRDNHVNASTFYAWRKKLSGETTFIKSQQVIPLVIHEPPFDQPAMIKLTTPNGFQLDFESTLTHQTLAKLLSVL
jgi:transposase